MRKIVFALVALGSVYVTSAMAAPTAGDVAAAANASQSQVQKADYYYRGWRRGSGPRFHGGGGYGYGGGYCYRWRHICADRWGWGGPGFRRCLWRHSC